MSGTRGFSLLEVLVALAILGLGLTTILSAQAGLFSTSVRAANLTLGVNLGRCKMNEIEARLLRDGYPFTDEKDEGPCCEDDQDAKTFACAWMIETVVLPEMQNMDDGGLGDDGGGILGWAQSAASAGPIPSAAGISGDLDLAEGPGKGMADMFGGFLPGGDSSMGGLPGGIGGLASMAISMVYPALKPMLEASIRRITVTVHWTEGKAERSFDLVEYVANPQQGGMLMGMPGYEPDGTEGEIGASGPSQDTSSDSKSDTKEGSKR